MMSLLSSIFASAPSVQPEPEIPSAMDDWDEEFKRATGDYPSFSRLRLDKIAAARAQLRFSDPFGGTAAGIMDGAYEAARLFQEQHEYDVQYTTLAKRLKLHPCDSPAILTSILGQRPGSSRKVPPA